MRQIEVADLSGTPSLLPGGEQRAERLLRRYFGPWTGPNNGFTGGHWDTFDPSGVRASTPNHFTADDLAACALLSTPIEGPAVIHVLNRQRPDFTALLSQIGEDRDFVTVEDPEGTEFAPVRELFKALIALPTIGATRATKLMARKRPRLIPIVDSVVKERVFHNSRRQWGPLHRALHLDNGALHQQLLTLHQRAGLHPAVSTIRVFDVLAWMEASPHADRWARAGETPRAPSQ